MREAIDDVTLTSYALGELSEAERTVIEARLAESEALRSELREIEATVALLRQAFTLAPQQALTGEQRSAIEAEALRSRPKPDRARRPLLMIGLAAAAVLALALGSWLLVSGGVRRQQPPSVTADRGIPAPPDRQPAPPPTVVADAARPRPAPAAPITHPPATVPPPAVVADTATPPPSTLVAAVSPAVASPAISTTGCEAPPSGMSGGGRFYATIGGTATDPTGAVVSGAKVTLTNEGTGVVRRLTSDSAGRYCFPRIPIGSYQVEVEQAGFKLVVVKNVLAHVDQLRIADAKLEPGAMAETVTVVADSGAPKLVGAEISGMIGGAQVRDLPLNGRNFLQLTQTQPVSPAVDEIEEFKVQQGGPSQGTREAVLPDSLRPSSAEFTTAAYDHIRDNPFVLVSVDPRSTFSVDVDTASYSIVRRFLNEGRLPPKDAVRIEELVNYFSYGYAPPRGRHPFSVHMEAASCPWQPEHRLVRIGIKGRELPRGERPPANLVFLVDVSGSMNMPNKLPLVKEALKLLVDQLAAQDRIAIVVYAGAEGLALPSTPGSDKATIRAALDSFTAGGTTHGSAGLRLAYQIADAGYIKGGVNRIVLATDGDFNVGITNQGDLVRLIEEKAKGGVFLTALGFGMDNLKDSTLEKLADHGNGNYAYIDSLQEARKVLVDQVSGTLVTIAKDVKLQLEWNPATVKAFRLIGYENRVLAHQDFNDDKKDAGEIGAGHTVTALYEIVPAGGRIDAPSTDALKYQQPSRPSHHATDHELLTLKLRYKQPEADKSQLLELTLADSSGRFEGASTGFRFATAVASFGMLLRDSPYKGTANLRDTIAWAGSSLGADEQGLRGEFLGLVQRARALTRER